MKKVKKTDIEEILEEQYQEHYRAVPEKNNVIESEIITPAMAQNLLATNTRNRSISNRRIHEYTRQIRDGQWRANGETIKIAEDGTLIDGQHRLLAVVAAKKSIEAYVIRNLPLNCMDTIDIGRKRTCSDFLAIDGVKYSTAIAAGLNVIMAYKQYSQTGVLENNHFTARSASIPSLIKAALRQNPGIIDSAQFIVNNKYIGRFIPRGIAVGLHYLFSEKDRILADDFFLKVSHGMDLKMGSPPLILRNRLLEAASNPSMEINRTYLIAYVIKAWNATKAGENMSVLRYAPTGAKAESFPEIQ